MGLKQMVNDQLVKRGIYDPNVLRAFRAVDRVNFMPTDAKHLAYIDSPVSIGHGQTISQPFIVAYMLQALHVQPTDKVLEVGTGSGYQTALLSEMAKSVYTVEIVEPLLNQAIGRLCLRNNIFYKLSENELGWPQEQPFDKIIVSAAAHDIPDELVLQLDDDGMMIIPVGNYFQDLLLMQRDGDKVEVVTLLPVRFVPLIY